MEAASFEVYKKTYLRAKDRAKDLTRPALDELAQVHSKKPSRNGSPSRLSAKGSE
jgi:hypothetical protein